MSILNVYKPIDTPSIVSKVRIRTLGTSMLTNPTRCPGDLCANF